MVTLLRRLRHSMVSDNKFGNYIKYAVGEIILVMIGILLALQVNNWNIERTERKSEIKYLKNIKLDLEKDLVNLDHLLKFRREKTTGIAQILETIDGKHVADLNQLAWNVFNTLNEDPFSPNDNTYQELESSGNLNLLSNDSIKVLMLDLQELYKQNRFGIDHETFDYREYVSKPLAKYTDMSKLLPIFTGQKTVDDLKITKESFTNLFANPEYKNGLVIENAINTSFIAMYQAIQAKSKKVISIIDRETDNK